MILGMDRERREAIGAPGGILDYHTAASASSHISTTTLPSHTPTTLTAASRRIAFRDSSQDDFESSIDDSIFSQEAVMITECDGESFNTAATLLYCRRRILQPRDFIISLLGYRSWSKDGADQSPCCKCFNVTHFFMVLACLCAAPVFQYNICLRRDEGIGNDSPMNAEVIDPSFNFTTIHDSDWNGCRGNMVFVYVIPAILFLLSYLITCLVLRFGETEHLQTLPERVFLMASCSPWELAKQRRLWCVFLTWMFVGGVCLTLTLTALILHLFAASHIHFIFIIPQSVLGESLVCGCGVALLWFQDVVLVIGLLLYCTQCHLLSRLLHIIRRTIYQGTTPLIAIKRQIDETSRFLRHLNQELGLSVGLYLCVVAFRACTAAVTLFSAIVNYLVTKTEDAPYTKDKFPMSLHFLAMLVNLLPWLVLLLLPLCTAARVTSSYRALCKAGSQLHGRPFGYQATPQPEIDSFLLYVSSLHLQAKVLWVPVRTYFIVSVVVLAGVSFIILGYLYF